MSARFLLFLCCAVGLSACATATTASRGATLLSGLKEYQGDMRSLSSESSWPERQRAGNTLKGIITVTVGASPEFYRLVDIDVRRREFEVTLRETHVSAERTKEMKEELIQMNEEIAALKPVIRAQLGSIPLDDHESEQSVADVAARGLLSLALDQFPSTGSRGLEAPATKVGPYQVTDLGSFATVRGPQGQTFRCIISGVAEEGAALTCDAVAR